MSKDVIMLLLVIGILFVGCQSINSLQERCLVIPEFSCVQEEMQVTANSFSVTLVNELGNSIEVNTNSSSWSIDSPVHEAASCEFIVQEENPQVQDTGMTQFISGGETITISCDMTRNSQELTSQLVEIPFEFNYQSLGGRFERRASGQLDVVVAE